jgi:hypothetical protein
MKESKFKIEFTGKQIKNLPENVSETIMCNSGNEDAYCVRYNGSIVFYGPFSSCEAFIR